MTLNGVMAVIWRSLRIR